MTNTNQTAEQFDDRYLGRVGVVNNSSLEKHLEKVFRDLLQLDFISHMIASEKMTPLKTLFIFYS